jgi:hypothetical protein
MFRLLAIALAVLVAGCSSGEDYSIVPVSGRVTLDGRPVPKARVVFQPKRQQGKKEAGPGSVARTDEDGRFTLELQTQEPGEGAVVGAHSVRVTTMEFIPDAPGSDSGTTTRELVPAYYATGIEMEVTGPTEDFQIELSSNPPPSRSR